MGSHLNSIYFTPGLAADPARYDTLFISRLSEQAEGGHKSQGLRTSSSAKAHVYRFKDTHLPRGALTRFLSVTANPPA